MTFTPEKDLNHNLVSANHRYACKDRPQPGAPWLPLEESNSCGHSCRTTDPHKRLWRYKIVAVPKWMRRELDREARQMGMVA